MSPFTPNFINQTLSNRKEGLATTYYLSCVSQLQVEQMKLLDDYIYYVRSNVVVWDGGGT